MALSHQQYRDFLEKPWMATLVQVDHKPALAAMVYQPNQVGIWCVHSLCFEEQTGEYNHIFWVRQKNELL